jgi:hypothetical protein
MGVNRPSIESSDLTTTRKLMPHTTSPNRENPRSVGDQGRCEGKRKRTLEKYRVSDSREEGE